MNHLTRLLDHMEWADARVIEALQQPGTIPKTVLDLFGHVVGAEHVWLARLTGVPETVAVWPKLTLDELAKVSRENIAGLRRFVAGLTPDDLHRGIAYTNSAGLSFVTGVEDILIHACMHASYHRGQIATAIRSSGLAPALTDYVAYIRGVATATAAK